MPRPRAIPDDGLHTRPVLRVALGWLLALAYLGDHVPWAQQIQPYRFVVPAMFLATLPAAHMLDTFMCQRVWHGLPHSARALAGVALLVITQHLAGEALYFFPDAMPRVRWFLDQAPSPITATGYAPHGDYRIAKPNEATAELARWLDARSSEGRVAVQDAALGEDLSWRSRAAITGRLLVSQPRALARQRLSPLARRAALATRAGAASADLQHRVRGAQLRRPAHHA